MLRTTHFPMMASPALSALRLSPIATFTLSSPSNLRSIFTCSSSCSFFPNTFYPSSHALTSCNCKLLLPIFRHPRGPPLWRSSGSVKGAREILVRHLIVKRDNQKLLLDLQQRISSGEDFGDLAVEYSICPSKNEGGMLGEETILQDIHPAELQAKFQDPNFMEEAQLIDVREPAEVEKASLPGFKVLPLRQFGNWAPEITTTLDPEKDTYVMGFKTVYSIAGGIHAYARKVDPTIPTYYRWW